MNEAFLAKLNTIGVDTTGALNRFAGNYGLYEKFLLKFLQDDNFTQIGPAIGKQDYETVLKAAHTLKGVAGNLGFQHLFTLCGDMVSAIRNGQTGDCEATFKAIKKAYEEVTQIIGDQKEAL